MQIAKNVAIFVSRNKFQNFNCFQAVGASSLSSQVSEHDDLPPIFAANPSTSTNYNNNQHNLHNNNVNSSTGGDELTLDTFQSANIQLFVLNNTTLLSLVEIPGLEEDALAADGGHTVNTAASSLEMAGFTTAPSQVCNVLLYVVFVQNPGLS